MWPSFANMLSWWQWLLLAAVPPAIVLLYFLKLRRRPLEVPSTYLWHKSIEDLHVNSIWQRLRRSLLLFLQLLLLVLIMLALLRPHWQGVQLPGGRLIFLVDNSASMQACDVQPSRLEEAKRQACGLIEQMQSGDVGMVISFSDTARVEQMFTDDRWRLRRAVEAIRPTARPTSLSEALKVASGLANPGPAGEEGSGTTGAKSLPADLFIFSDGKFAPVAGLSLGNLQPHFVPIGGPEAANVGIMAFSVRRSEAGAGLLTAFARLENFGERDADVSLELRRDGRMIDAAELTLAGGKSGSVAFDVGSAEPGVLELQAATGDKLALDDRAWAVINAPRAANVLLVTPGNEPLELALQTGPAKEIANVAIQSPAFLKTDAYRARAEAGGYDLVIYDRCQPKVMPQANTLLIGRLPPAGGWSAKPKVDVPQIIDIEAAHPLLQWIDLGDVILLEGTPLERPPGGSVLVDTDQGAMLALAPRERFEDAVLGFVIVDEVAGEGGQPQQQIGTNWPSRQSFPVFVLNLLEYFGGGRKTLDPGSVRPGRPMVLESPTPEAKLSVMGPGGQAVELPEDKPGRCNFTGTEELGPYEVRADQQPLSRFAVNLFDAAESDIRPKPEPSIQIGYDEVAGQPGWEATRRETWKGLLLMGLVVLLLEWYIYSRRVYV
jgi:hypothetical protein